MTLLRGLLASLLLAAGAGAAEPAAPPAGGGTQPDTTPQAAATTPAPPPPVDAAQKSVRDAPADDRFKPSEKISEDLSGIFKWIDGAGRRPAIVKASTFDA